ncbi:MAG: type II toxin-antitoxin system RelE/ParE family toxin [Candidatus Electrothrix sp. AR1]|nr:type II toxin-antitoxin system RelE/ParE family toxin [Candidatus Electrothrix sp. AR1]
MLFGAQGNTPSAGRILCSCRCFGTHVLTRCIPKDTLRCIKYTLQSTKQYEKWFTKLKDSTSKTKILARLARVENGNFGDSKQLGDNLFELRFFFGPGFRVYYTIRNNRIVLLLAGGDKASQKKDINLAARLLQNLEN